jgi:uncharacterized cupredoxin-like copper-binding protein
MSGLRRHAIVPTVALLLFAVACSSDDEGGGGGGGTPAATGGESGAGSVAATEADFTITLDPTNASAGDVNFAITNQGPSTHEFVVFKTDLAPDDLPTSDDGTVDETGTGVEHIDEVEDIAAASDATLDVNLDAGNYVVICNLPGHYQQGMHAALTVG